MIGSDSTAEAKEASTESAIKVDVVDEYMMLMFVCGCDCLESCGFYFMSRRRMIVTVSTFPVICVV